MKALWVRQFIPRASEKKYHQYLTLFYGEATWFHPTTPEMTTNDQLPWLRSRCISVHSLRGYSCRTLLFFSGIPASACWPSRINTRWKVCRLEDCGKAGNGAVLGLGFGICVGPVSLQRFDLWIQKTNEVDGVPPWFFYKINLVLYGGGMFYEWWRPPQAIHIPEPPCHRRAPWHREAGIWPSFLFAAQYITVSRRHQR